MNVITTFEKETLFSCPHRSVYCHSRCFRVSHQAPNIAPEGLSLHLHHNCHPLTDALDASRYLFSRSQSR